MKSFIFIFFFLFSCPVWSLSFDWSGWTRLESYYQNSSDHNYYGGYHFVLQPKIHVIDGLYVMSRMDISSLGESVFSSSEHYRQTGFVFIYGEDSKQRSIEVPRLFLKISQMYLDYSTEFFKIRLGRAPYHFGMGTIYSASQDPFQHWMSVYNQAALYLEHSQFYLQPLFLHQDEGSLLGMAQAGLLNEKWQVEALFRYDFKDSSVVELFGQYEEEDWGVKSSLAYAIAEGTNMTMALEAFVQIPQAIPFQFEIKTGGAFGHLSFHPNYNVALLSWNRFITDPQSSATPKEESSTTPSFFQIAQGQIQKGLYFSPRLLFSFLNDNLKIRPLGLLARDLDKEKFNYEFDLEGSYQLDESLFFSLKGGVLYTESFHLALLAQAAVSF